MFGWSCLRVHGLRLMHVVFFLELVNTKQSEILLADKTIDGCVIAAVVDKGLTAAQHDWERPGRVRIGDHHHVVQGSGLRLYFIFYGCF